MDDEIQQADQALDNQNDQAADAADGQDGDADLLNALGDEESPADAADLADVEYEGKQYKLPPELKDALLRQSDYTRKTQEVAEQRKAIEAQAEEVKQRAAIQRDMLQGYAQLSAIDGQLKQYEQVNWNQLSDEDPAQAQKLWINFQQLQQAHGTLAQQLQQAEQKAAFETHQATARRIEEGQKQLASEITGWSPELQQKLVEHGSKLGASKEALNGISEPWIVRALHKAMQYDQLVEKARQRPKESAPAKPLEVVRSNGGRPTTTPNDKMSTEEWMKAEEARLRAKRK